MTSYYKDSDGEVGIFWERIHINGDPIVKIRLFSTGKIRGYKPEDLTWCKRNGEKK